MNRRSLLGGLTAMASMFCMNVGFSSGSKMTGVQKNGFFEVKGSPENCRAFAEAFQTNLWPEWRTHSNDIARRTMQRCESSWKSGCAMVSSHGRQCQDALIKTLNQFSGKLSFPSSIAAIVIAFVCFSRSASAQCENGMCLLPKVASTVQNVVSMPVRLVASVATSSGQDCGCVGQCGKQGCNCDPVSVASPALTSVGGYQAVAAVPIRTPIRTVFRALFQTRPLQRLFRCW